MESQLAKKTITSIAWTYLSYILSKSVVLVTTIILTRLLSPAEFGIVGFAVTTMSFLDAVRDLGMSLALIQRRDRVEDAADTVFWLSISTDVIIWLFACAITPLMASFFREPQINTVLPVISFSFVLSGLGGTHDALLQREMKFSRRIIPSLSEGVSKAIVSIILALSGAGVWALVFGQLTGRGVFSAVAWRVMPWRPRLRIYWDLARDMLSYGLKIAGDAIISALQANIDYVFIGRFLGEVSLGLYTVAFRVPEMIIINFCIVIAHVLFPAYSILQDNLEQLRNSVKATLRYISLVTIPAGAGLALVSNLFALTIFGEKYADAGPIMAALSIYGVFLSVGWNIGDVYKAIGRPDILWKTALVEFTLLAPVLYILAHENAFAVSVGHVVVASLVTLFRLAIAMYLLKLTPRETFSQFIPATVGAATMGVAVFVCLQLTSALPNLIALILSILVGAVVYSVTLWFIERDLAEGILDKIRNFRDDDDDDDEAVEATTADPLV